MIPSIQNFYTLGVLGILGIPIFRIIFMDVQLVGSIVKPPWILTTNPHFVAQHYYSTNH